MAKAVRLTSAMFIGAFVDGLPTGRPSHKRHCSSSGARRPTGWLELAENARVGVGVLVPLGRVPQALHPEPGVALFAALEALGKTPDGWPLDGGDGHPVRTAE